MQAKAIAKYIGMSPRKVRLVVDQIRGLPVNQAYAILRFSKKAASVPVGKTLRSAVANAEYRAEEDGEVLDVDELVIKRAFVDGGRTMKRWRAAAMGRAAPIRRRSSHITIVVDSEE